MGREMTDSGQRMGRGSQSAIHIRGVVNVVVASVRFAGVRAVRQDDRDPGGGRSEAMETPARERRPLTDRWGPALR
jgi:hypothetical protein